ncbi:MAG: hypothetical protein ACC660_06460, partial [Acidimicrobiales bacterium]
MTEHNDNIDELYEAFKPRLIAARRSYIRKRLAVAATLPLFLGGAVAWALPQDNEQNSQLAAQGGEPLVDTPAEEPEPEAVDVDTTAARSEEPAAEEAVPEPSSIWMELGFAGSVYLADTDAGLEVTELDLNPGWTAEQLQMGNKSTVVLVLANGDVRLVASIEVGGDGEPSLKIEDVSPEPEPEVQTRKEIAVGDVGTVVLERDGDQLWLGVSWNHSWWEPVVVQER